MTLGQWAEASCIRKLGPGACCHPRVVPTALLQLSSCEALYPAWQAGYFCIAKSTSATASICPAGKYSEAGQGACSDCPAGLYSSSTGVKTSLDCSGTCTAGYACPAGSTTGTVSLCNPGLFSSAGAGSCTPCLPGKYSGQGASSCSDCAIGKYSLGTAYSCQDCSAGRYGSSPASSDSQCSGACQVGLRII